MSEKKRIKRPNWRKNYIEIGKIKIWVEVVKKESLSEIYGRVITFNKKFKQGSMVKYSLDDIVYFGNMFRTETDIWKDLYKNENTLEVIENKDNLKIVNVFFSNKDKELDK